MKKYFKAVLSWMRENANDLALAAGGMTVTLGAGMIYIPAGVISGGVLMIAGAILNSFGGGDGS